jgi:hypothetical protein
MLGDIAIERRILTPPQVEQILRLQKGQRSGALNDIHEALGREPEKTPITWRERLNSPWALVFAGLALAAGIGVAFLVL